MKRYLVLILVNLLTTTAFAFEAHEWGTFTSLVGSNGKTQNGMYHEDEKLPDFVHEFGQTQNPFEPFPSDPSCANGSFKTCFSLPVLENNFVSQKMETPVIYFYGEGNEQVKVDVEFPEGIITETYPAPVTSSPKNTPDLVIANGKATFDVQLLDRDVSLPFVESGNIYSHARRVDSLAVRTGLETERFIFYRGLGRFNPRISMSSSRGDFSFMVSHRNDKPQAAYLVYYKPGAKPHLMPIIGEGSRVKPQSIGFGVSRYALSEKEIADFKNYQESTAVYGGDVYEALEKGLQTAGLKSDEAKAMVDTWDSGYFHTPGLRLLYILPREEVDQILPLTMTPKAEKMERVFVARMEIMTQKEEFELVSLIMDRGEKINIGSLGRFAESKLRRAREVYIEQQKKFQPDIPNFKYGMNETFDNLVRYSMTGETSPVLQ